MIDWRRIRHTYGFGVHSPFAFRMVKEVVSPGRGYAWYGYEDIDAAVNSSRAGIALERRAKMFHRLIAFLNPESIFLPLGIEPLYYTAAAAMGTSLRIERKPNRLSECRMVATHEDFLPLEELKRHIAQPGNSIVFLNAPEGWREEIFEAMPEGLMLYGEHNGIIVNREGMMKVSYSVRI